MNITVNVDCTPEEARRFMGLPDLSSVHDAYLDKMRTLVSDGVTPDNLESLMKSWGPLGEAGLGLWQRLFEQMTKPTK